MAHRVAPAAILRYWLSMPLKIATWNINSVRIRGSIIKQFVDSAQPDILCLQETKVTDDLFPMDALRELGFPHITFTGQKSYNGVAILSKLPLTDIETYDMIGNGNKRHIAATLPGNIRLHNFYVPAGGDIPDPELNPKFKEKLAFVDNMAEWSKELKNSKHQTVIVGDFNIAPLEHDVWSHKQLLTVVSHTPIEVEKLNRLKDVSNWADSARCFTPPEEKLYSWWSYRNRDWKKSNRGRRLDHIWVTPGLKSSLKSCITFRDARDWLTPSDHVPVMTTLSI